ncbi:Eco57I restriction-modification methylase domain-containing protein [Amycolatopsis minnesotensis]|uniref:site-specific DNA-methyltransferase (adenine-specific) n=1 Tax=Amycolatopsis minnesotensis TaxID=337894 RepID=A0ABP5B9B7_9PSEU
MRPRRTHAPDSAQQHRDWLSLIEVSGPFLSLPVLRSTWPTLDSLDRATKEKLRLTHATWQENTASGQRGWIDHLLGELLEWGDALRWAEDEDFDALSMDVPEHDTRITPAFALVDPGEDAKPRTTQVLGLICASGTQPTARIKGEASAATTVDRLAQLCRHHEVQLGLATDGRWCVLVSAPRGKVTTTAVFDTVAWNEAAEIDVVRAFVSMLRRSRFYGVHDDEKLIELLRKSEDSQEEITEALGVQVRQAVELLVAAIGRADTAQRDRGGKGLDVSAYEVYRGAVTVMMRIVFLLFAEERKLLPSDTPLYASTYSAGRLCARLEQQAREGSEDDLEYSDVAWHRLLAVFDAVYYGISHPRLRMHAHNGSLFGPFNYAWLPRNIDDRTVLHMLRAVQYVEIGTGRSKERRKLSFRELDVEQIGYVYEGLLSFDGFRADDVTLGLIGKAGLEDEVALRDLTNLAAGCPDVPALAAALAERYKSSGIGSVRALEKKLAPLTGVEKEAARRKLLAVTRGDAALTDQLLVLFGIIRQDLREQPVVIMPGELFVTESPLRKNSGTHYTPRSLAEQIVDGALEPLAYEPGPLHTANKDEWKLKSSDKILALKVADIAMGSAAFLVAAARYLASKLIEAWAFEGDSRVRDYRAALDAEREADQDPVVIEARRQIIEHCLYGVDINPMAVEMAKLSLWLVSMDPYRPFTFLDDRLVTGDSLLGITSLDQLEWMHMDPAKGRQIHEGGLFDLTIGVRELVADVADARRTVADIDGTTLEGLGHKREVLADLEQKTGRAQLLADLCVGGALTYAKRGDHGLRDGSLAAADYARRIRISEEATCQQAQVWLNSDRPDSGFSRKPLHWPIIFPEVFTKGGFDAVIGNPPFLGGPKLRPAFGLLYREYLSVCVANNIRGTNTDLIAYFALRAHALLDRHGQTGLIATNTLAQGDTREVGLDQIRATGVEIRQAVKSSPWPSKSAILEYCVIWTSRASLDDKAVRRLDGEVVNAITTSLDPGSRTAGPPKHLAASSGIAYQGVDIGGTGFTVPFEIAEEMIKRQPKNKEVLFPYLNGQDLNSNPDCFGPRWVICFHDWEENKAKTYGEAYKRVLLLVKPDRETKSPAVRSAPWWQYWRRRPGLKCAIAGLDRVIVIALVSKTVMPLMVPTGQVFSHMLAVFATDDPAMLALLSSAPHYWWAKSRGSSMKTDLRYTPSDVFETFARPPALTGEMRQLGNRLDAYRRDVMLSRNSGLTKTYNMVFDPRCTDGDIEDLRRIHREIDEATICAYGWKDRIAAVGGLFHGFHKVGRETRYTVGPAAQREILDSLLELNHERHAEEVAQGLHDKKGKSKRTGETLF